MLKSIITCCTKNDLQVLKYSIINIRKYIGSCDINVYVPDIDYDYFLELVIDGNLIIHKDSSLISSSEMKCIIKELSEYNKQKMTGWYVQQFIKIKAAAQYRSEDAVLIWDSDTIPLRPLNFVNTDGSLNYFVSSEYHEPYFKTIKNILGISKKIAPSFISQCFPLYSRFAKELIDSLGGNERWISSIMQNLDRTSDCAFSEYETLGSYIANYYPEKINIDWTPWERDGYKKLLLSKDIPSVISACAFHFAFVAIEKSERNKFKYILSIIKSFTDKILN